MNSTILSKPDAVLMASEQAGPCGGCKQARYLWIARGGRVKCWECDHEREWTEIPGVIQQLMLKARASETTTG